MGGDQPMRVHRIKFSSSPRLRLKLNDDVMNIQNIEFEA